MELRTLEGQLTPGGVFKVVATGYLIGAGAIAYCLLALMEVLGASPVTSDGPIVKALVLILVVPLVVGVQGLILGAGGFRPVAPPAGMESSGRRRRCACAVAATVARLPS
jgi:hypothetical protein